MGTGCHGAGGKRPAATTPAAAQPALPDWFNGIPANPTGAPDSSSGKSTYGHWLTPSATPNADGSPGGDVPSKMSTSDLYDAIAHNEYAINIVWTLIEGFLVMFMQLGFAMVETGLCRAKNSGHTFAMNMMIYPLGCLGFYVYGFALGWGNWWNGPAAPGWYASLGPGLSVLSHPLWAITTHNPDGTALHTWTMLGGTGWFLHGVNDVGVMALFFFEMVFMDTTATIPTGTMAERWRWPNFCLYGLLVALPYCINACWVWGGGWTASLGSNWGWGNGACDFAGSGVVHMMGGVIALAGGMAIGPRIGKYINGKAQAIPGHDLPMVMGGTFILAFGWFGFNPGSTLSGTDLRISFIVVNTMLASITAALAAMCVMWLKFGKPDPSMMCNGMLAGLVAITAPCAFVSSMGACIIGVVAGVLVVYSVFFFDKVGVDDCVGAISVHGTNGLWGILSVGLLANGEYGLGYNGVGHTVLGLMPIWGDPNAAWFSANGWQQLLCQSLEGLQIFVLGFGIMFTFFKISNLFVRVRVSPEVEMQGLDLPEMGAMGYPDFELKTTPSFAQSSDTRESIDRPYAGKP